MIRPTRLRLRLMRQFAALALVPLAALTLLAALALLPSLIASAEERNRLLATALRDQVEQQLAARQRMAQVLANDLAKRSLGDADINLLLADWSRSDPFIQAVLITDAQGAIRHIALPAAGGLHTQDLIGLDQSAQPHYQRARASGTIVWSETFLSTLTSRITVVLVVPAGERTIMVEISLEELSQALAAMGRAGAVRAVVLDRAGRIIGHPSVARSRRQESLAHLPLVERALAGVHGSGRITLDGEEFLAEVLPVQPTEWHVLVAEPTRTVLAPLVRLAWLLLICLAATIAAAGALAWWLARRSGIEVQRLTDAAQGAVDGPAPPPSMHFETAEFAELWARLTNLFEHVRDRDLQTGQARRQLQAVLDAATEVAIVATELDGTVRMFSRGAAKMLGYVETDMLGQATPRRWHVPAQLAARAKQLAQELARPIDELESLFALPRQAGHEVRDWTYVAAGGAKLEVSVAVTAMRGADGSLSGFLVVATDVTERRRAAELEVARRAAEAASQAKSDFLSRMSHELRSPLNAMLGYAQLLEMDGVEPPSPTQRERARQIQRSGWYLVQLIDDVLDLARIEAGNMRVSLEAIAPAAVMARAAEMAAPLMKRHGIAFEPGPGGPVDAPRVLADMTRLTQVLVNLLSNAAKYNRSGGSVEMDCVALADARLSFRVRDSGRGMSPAQLAGLFEPFNRLGLETSGIEGTGIGLVITRRLVGMMNGSIEVDSHPGQGSTFTVTLPQAPKAPAGGPVPGAPATPHAPPGGTRRARIVYIEDNIVNATLMSEMMRKRPQFELQIAATAREGLDLLRRQRPDLLLLDMHLPDASGHDVMDAIEMDPQLRGLAIVVVSADATHQQVSTTLRRGVLAYLTKPIDIPEALATIDRALDLQEAVSAAPTEP